jgi:Raf kinase inhibitor-like YbhB/YbcL family protein
MSKNVLKATLVLLAAGLVAAPNVSAQRGGGGFQMVPLLMETSAFPDGGIVPVRYSGAGENIQPGFTFSNIPEGTVSFALVMTDIDPAFQSPVGFMHWAAWNIPVSAGGIPEGGLPDGSMQTQRGYRGPGAPPGPRYHHYVFELFALNDELELPATASREEIFAALEGKVVGKAAYVGRFRREG